MAKKRMFSLGVLDTDAFLDMPLSAQALYFHLSLRADDDGFIGNPKRITQNVGASLDDLRILIAKRFVLTFEDGVIVIKHWRMHNTIKRDRYTATNYAEDLKLLNIKENGAYTFREDCGAQMEHKWSTDGEQMSHLSSTGLGIDKDIGLDIGLDKGLDKSSKDIDIKPPLPPLPGEGGCNTTQRRKKQSEVVNERFERFWSSYPRKQSKINARKAFEKISPSEELLGKMLSAIGEASKSQQWTKDGGQFIPLPATWLNQRRWEDEFYTMGGELHDPSRGINWWDYSRQLEEKEKLNAEIGDSKDTGTS